ncbi:hypothetical protein ENUP19_0255G0002 [Entamoeba nuttalli]|uniref:Uncharacterized protein n=3 Tax=Entamoeba nuttalli TaxID=412467 RepID=K2GA48_ENTNP|nr:hypothetical protein ENU1_132610 [Entamoeba nuttalli P19]EKE39341.1 hypothetical protein ENU1_132610 [Entamoeba nuttalli P19]|eukprot:XP_008858325.1 hypothetical protein ENU1_132610 [Entamoeba nuttalli P19]
MKVLFFLALVFIVNADNQPNEMKEYLSGEWKFYQVETTISDDSDNSEDNESEIEEREPLVAMNITARTDVADMLDVIINDDNEKYYQISIYDGSTIEVQMIGDEVQEDKLLITMNFHNVSDMYIAEGTFRNISYTAYIPRTDALVASITTYQKDEEGKVIVTRYIGEKTFVDKRTFFQKYQMFIMMGLMMLFQMFMGQPGAQAPAQAQQQAAQ